MRLIDADALKEQIKDKTHYLNYEHANQKDVIDMLDNAPTVEPFEIIGAICNENCGFNKKHGKWEVDGTFYKNGKESSVEYRCSLCKRRIIWTAHEGGKTKEEFLQEYPFCHCGADMRML